jgi:hypothetical protein
VARREICICGREVGMRERFMNSMLVLSISQSHLPPRSGLTDRYGYSETSAHVLVLYWYCRYSQVLVPRGQGFFGLVV